MPSKRSLRSFTNTFAVAASLLFAATVPAAYAQKAVQVNPEIKHDVSPPFRDLAPKINPEPHPELDILRIPRPYAADLPDGALQTSPQHQVTPASLLTAGANFDGLGLGFTGFHLNSAPPDNNLTVGPNHIVDIVNTYLVVLSKTGTTIMAPRAINTLWTGFGGGCEANNDGDPVAKYDQLADRWVIAQFSVSTLPYLQCVAVSTSGDPTGAYNRYSFNYGSVDFPDYPKMGVWPDGYYTTYNFFANGQSFVGAEACAFDRAKMLAGQTATQQCFSTGANYGGLLPADLDGAVLPPGGSPNYMVALGVNNTQLAFWKFHADFTTPANSTFTGPANITVAGFSPACGGGTCIVQKSTTQKLDSLADRLMYRLAYRNFGDHESLFVDHSVSASGGVGMRWYELRNPGTTPTVYQQGTFAPDARYRWMGSIAADQLGNLAMGYSLSSSTDYPTINYTGRVPGDALGTMETEATLFTGTGAQTNGLTRWGDYTSMAIDPSDDCTFWYTNEYLRANGSFNWNTRIGSFKFPTCGGVQNPDFTFGATPATLTVTQGASGNYTATATSVGGFAGNVTVSISGLPTGATATFTPNPIAVTSGGSGTSTVNVSTTGATPPGTYPLIITGASDALTHTASVSLTVTANTADFTFGATPATLTVAQGASGNYTATATSVNGFAGNVTASISGLPTGATATFTPNPIVVPSGGSGTSIVNVSTTTATPVGTYPLSITGTSGALVHLASVSLAVTAGGGGGGTVSVTPTSINFGNGFVGAVGATYSVNITNTGSTQVTVNSATTTANFSATTTCGTLNPGASCRVYVTFAPTTVGTITGTLSINDTATGSPQTVALSGKGNASLYIYPASLNFGTVSVGTTSAAKTITVTNQQRVAMMLNGITVSGDYAQTGGTCPSGTGTLAARTSCTVQVKFTPTATGSRPGAVAISDNAPDSPLTVPLSGTGR